MGNNEKGNEKNNKKNYKSIIVKKMNKNRALMITVQKAPNFGACLQAYALWKYVSNLGFECKIIDLLRPYHKEFVYTKGFDMFCSKE